jgi:hypothetical protein
LKPGVNFSWNTFAENKISRFVLSEGYKDIGGAPNNDITAFTIPVSAETIVSHAFENNQIARLSIPGNVKTIGAYSFSGNKLTSLRIPKNVESIEGYAFADNPLEWVTIDNKSIKIGATSFPPKIMNSLTKQLASTIGYDDLAREMNKWQGKTVKISGRISQINDPETSQPKIYLDLSGDWDFSLEWDYKKIFVRYRYEDNEVRFLENDRVTIWGTVTGISEHRSNLDILGRATSKLPEINARIIERQKTGGL